MARQVEGAVKGRHLADEIDGVGRGVADKIDGSGGAWHGGEMSERNRRRWGAVADDFRSWWRIGGIDIGQGATESWFGLQLHERGVSRQRRRGWSYGLALG